MDFVSAQFLIFITAVCTLYFIVPAKYRWLVLLAASYVFYFVNSRWLVLCLFAETVVTYYGGRRIRSIFIKRDISIAGHDELSGSEKREIKKVYQRKARTIMLVCTLFCLGMLLYLKYFNFFIMPINKMCGFTGFSIEPHKLLLPIGISFYTLQAMAYVIDVYHGKIKADRHLLKYMLFMSYFPQIVQGPIPRYSELAEQLYVGHRFDYTRVCYGLQLMMWGFFKKVVIADRIATPVNMIFNNFDEYHGLIVFLAAAGYGIQIYSDFSGGMDIARGLSQILGIDMVLNFRQPYFSTSIEEFWRRWHITLGGWMRDYVFYPLSLSKLFTNMGKKLRKVFGSFAGKRIPAFIAMFIVYFLVGFWHGASLRFIAYGIWNGIFIASGILLSDTYDKIRSRIGIDSASASWKFFQIARTFFICSLGRLFSRGDGLRAALHMMRSVFDRWYDLSFLTDGSMLDLGLGNAEWYIFLLSVIILLLVDIAHERGIHIRESIARQHLIFRWIIYFAAIAFILIFGVYGPEYDSANFIYEKF